MQQKGSRVLGFEGSGGADTRSLGPLNPWTLVRFVALGCVLALVCLTAGCTIARWYAGVPLRGDPAVLVKGESTKSDVLQLFGPPTQITHQTDGDVFVYTYDRWNYSSFTVAEPITGQRVFTYTRGFNNRDRLVVLFDYFGVVRGLAVERETKQLPTL
jgi:outer membrane protein assembly factor BamE (lipoprotein component of BamABCDE complex)